MSSYTHATSTTAQDSIRMRLKRTSLMGTLAPVGAVLAVTILLVGVLNIIVTRSVDTQGEAQLSTQSQDMLAVCASQQELLTQMVNRSLNIALQRVTEQGGISFASAQRQWNASNQLNNQFVTTTLPVMQLSGRPTHQRGAVDHHTDHRRHPKASGQHVYHLSAYERTR